MKNKTIKCMEYEFFVSNEKNESPRVEAEKILLTPTLDFDFKIECDGAIAKEAGFYASCALAVATHFFKIRGLPIEEIEIKTPVSNFKLIKDVDFAVIKLQKCKYNFTKQSLKARNVEIALDIDNESGIALYEVENIDDFDEKNLPEILVSLVGKAKAVAVYSIKEGECFVKGLGNYSALGIAIAIFQKALKNGSSRLNFIFENGCEAEIISLCTALSVRTKNEILQ